MHPTNCLNCEAELRAGFKYCVKCGQKADTHRLHFHEVGHDVLHYLTHADKGIFHLIRELALRPGRVAREYLAGKRQKYFKPVNFYLIVVGIMVFMSSYFHYIDDSYVKRMEENVAAIKDTVVRQELYRVVERVKTANYYFSKYSNIVNILATPFYAAIFWLFYRRAGYSYIEHLVANMYFMGFFILVFSLLLTPWHGRLAGSGNSMLYLIILFSGEVLYRTIAYYRFIDKKGIWPFLKALGVSIVPVFIWIGGGMVLVNYYIKTGFN